MLVYKIFRDSEWQALRDKGSSNGAAIDLTDGYMHLSTGEQSAETQVGALARWRAIPAPLPRPATRRSALGQTAATRRWQPRVS